MASHWLFYNCLPSVKELASSLPVNYRLFLCSVTGTDSKSMVIVNTGREDVCSVCTTHNCLQLRAPYVKKNWTESLHDMAPKDCDGQIPKPLTMERNIIPWPHSLLFFWNPLWHGTSWTCSVLLPREPSFLSSWLFCYSLHESATLLCFNFPGD